MIIDYGFYTSVYQGEAVEEAAFPSLLRRAEDAVGALTRFQVTEETIESYPLIIRTLYKKALCAQVEYLNEIGTSSAVTGEYAAARGFTVGKVRVGAMDRVAETTGNGVSPAVRVLLEQTGLTARHAQTFDGLSDRRWV